MYDFENDPRGYALELWDEGVLSSETLLIACLKYMSNDDVRDMLDCNELSPRFLEDEDDYNEGPDGHRLGW